MASTGDTPSTTVVAIVGGGPRGVVVLGRLLARLAAGGGPRRRVTIHLVDPAENGRVWPTDLPGFLLMNSRVGDVTLFSGDALPELPAVAGGLDFLTWLRQQPDEADVPPAGFATRRAFARHLAWARGHLATLPTPGVRVVQRRARVTAITAAPGGLRRLRLEDAGGATDLLDAAAVVLATGHQEAAPDTAAARRERAAGHVFVPPHMVGEVDLERLEPGQRVAVLGTGLNFFDLVAALTEGRGGRFVRDGQRLRYLPSGREPRLVVGSRRGVPHLSRAVAPERAHPRFLTADVLRRLVVRPGLLDFRADVWPLIALDLAAAHAEAACGDDALDLDRVLDPLAPGGVPTLFDDEAALTGWMIDLLTADAAGSRCRPRDAMRAVGEMLAALTPAVRTLVARGRIDGRSYRHDVEGWFNGVVAHLSSGPPVLRFEQLIALAGAGVVAFAGSRVALVDDGLRCPNLGATLAVDAAVEARLFAGDARRSGDPLTAGLVRSGRARPHRVPTADGAGAETAALDVTRDDFRLVGAGGDPDPRVYAIGVPLEGVHWMTAALPAAHHDDLTLRSADRIALAVLRQLAGAR